METVVVNKEKGEKNIPKFKYKLNSSEAIGIYVAIYIILFLVCKLIYFLLANSIKFEFDTWCPVFLPYICALMFTIVFSTKLVMTNRIDFFKKYVILAETVTIFHMWYGTYTVLNLKDSSGNFINSDILAIIFLVLQLIVMLVSLCILKHNSKELKSK